jgi:hypothetical protein
MEFELTTAELTTEHLFPKIFRPNAAVTVADPVPENGGKNEHLIQEVRGSRSASGCGGPRRGNKYAVSQFGVLQKKPVTCPRWRGAFNSPSVHAHILRFPQSIAQKVALLI